jgi:hypothetical protein
MNTRMKCQEKMSEAWVGLDADENVTQDDVSRTSKTTETGGVLNENDMGVNMTEKDDCSETSESSTNSQSNAQLVARHNEAQSKLLHHAETAMALFGNNKTEIVQFIGADESKQKPTLSTDSSTTQGPKPIACTSSPMSKVTEIQEPSVDQRMVLQSFSTCLKKGGVEVLKLSRWNVWQVRYLTVSREVQQLNGDVPDPNSSPVCPKALLWLKQSGKSIQNRSLYNIKDNGRGGMLFESLKLVVPIASNEYYDRHLPKRLKNKFPEFAGVLIHYMFITTMRIIKDVGNRTSETEKSEEQKLESTPTVSSGTKSHDS